jgi:hypothetical protein
MSSLQRFSARQRQSAPAAPAAPAAAARVADDACFHIAPLETDVVAALPDNFDAFVAQVRDEGEVALRVPHEMVRRRGSAGALGRAPLGARARARYTGGLSAAVLARAGAVRGGG